MSKELSGQPHVNVADLVSVPSKKRTSEEDGSGLPSKKRVVSFYDSAALSTMVEAIKQPFQQQ